MNAPLRRSGMARILKGSHSFTCTSPRVRPQRNEPYLPLPSQPKMVLIYRPRRDGRVSWPWRLSWPCDTRQMDCVRRTDGQTYVLIANAALQYIARPTRYVFLMAYDIRLSMQFQLCNHSF